jgi:hypothetical protein
MARNSNKGRSSAHRLPNKLPNSFRERSHNPAAGNIGHFPGSEATTGPRRARARGVPNCVHIPTSLRQHRREPAWQASSPSRSGPALSAKHVFCTEAGFHLRVRILPRREPRVCRAPENCSKRPFSVHFGARSLWRIFKCPGALSVRAGSRLDRCFGAAPSPQAEEPLRVD